MKAWYERMYKELTEAVLNGDVKRARFLKRTIDMAKLAEYVYEK